MTRFERILNRRLVRRVFNYYGNRGKGRIEELFGKEREKSLSAFLGRIPIKIALDVVMKKIGVDEGLKKDFFSRYHNKQTILNICKTIGEKGLKMPFRTDGPLLVVWNFTNLCNLSCRYCYQSAGKRLSDELTFEEKIDLINQMMDANTTFLAFSGGEPILGERFLEVLNYASRYFHTSIATNGILLADKNYVDKIIDNGAKNVFVSLDGASVDSHDFIRGEGSFERTVKGIKNLVASKHILVGINTVVTRRNHREVPYLLNLAVDLGVNSFCHYNYIPTGRGKGDFDMDLTPEQRENLFDLLYEWHTKRGETRLSIVSTAPNFARVIYQRSSGESAGLSHYTTDKATSIRGILKYVGGCGAGRVYASIQPNGDVGPCVFMPAVVIGSIRKERLTDIWQKSDFCLRLSDRENYHYSCPEFQSICGGCRARALAYGDALGDDPGCIIHKIRESRLALKEEREVVAV